MPDFDLDQFRADVLTITEQGNENVLKHLCIFVSAEAAEAIKACNPFKHDKFAAGIPPKGWVCYYGGYAVYTYGGLQPGQHYRFGMKVGKRRFAVSQYHHDMLLRGEYS